MAINNTETNHQKNIFCLKCITSDPKRQWVGLIVMHFKQKKMFFFDDLSLYC
jgi:hypothetical protein